MTWGELKNSVLGLMFSNVSGSSAVTTSDVSVAEYVLNMPDAANAAFADLSSVCPFVKQIRVPIDMGASLKELIFDLQNLCPGYINFLSKEVYTEDESGVLYPFSDFMLYGKDGFRLLSLPEGNILLLSFVCMPIVCTKATPEETEIDYPLKALNAACYYMAHRLYLEDDISISMQYLNYYLTLKEELKTEFSRAGFGLDVYSNKAGWL